MGRIPVRVERRRALGGGWWRWEGIVGDRRIAIRVAQGDREPTEAEVAAWLRAEYDRQVVGEGGAVEP